MSGSTHLQQPGTRDSRPTTIKVLVMGEEGRSSFARLEQSHGRCTGEAGGQPVNAVQRYGSFAEIRNFEAPDDLCSVIGDGVHLAEGVQVTVRQEDPANCTLEGSGAAFVSATRGIAGVRQAAFPSMPAAWVSAIRIAAERR